ncbi:MAG: hypothetical protein OXR66_08560 [Candidatus Woesearchaeota archaeon]|nr:hypothetical protein [Candidatus Woesearchaeota archaeon]
MAGQINAILVFILLVFGFGYSVLWLTKARQEKHIVLYLIEVAGLGLGLFSFIGVVFHLLHIPLHVSIYLIAAFACPLADVLLNFKKKLKKISWKLQFDTTTICAFLLLMLMCGFFLVFHKGAFIYPYLENDDPYNHALGSMYVSRMHTYSVDPAVAEISGGYAKYLEPYPPTYDVLMGVLRQMNDSMLWTLKFFNVLLITLGLAFYYLLFRRYLDSDRKALFGTFVLAALPSFMSHFIWSQTLALVLFPVALYSFQRALDDTTWRIPAILMIASVLVTQPVVSFLFGLVVLLLVFLLFLHEYTKNKGSFLKRIPKTKEAFIVGALGVATSFLFWGVQLLKWGVSGISGQKSGELSTGWGGAYALQQYTLTDIIFAPHNSRIDQAIGFGWVISLLLVLSIIVFFLARSKVFSLKKHWRYIHIFIWFLVLAYLVFAPTLGLPGWGSSRFWAYLAIPLALLVTEGTFILLNSISKDQRIKIGILVVLVLGICFTSVPAKIAVQQANWPPGAQWTFAVVNNQPTHVELGGYLNMMNTLPKNSRVFVFCTDDNRAVAFDMQSDPWNYDIVSFRKEIVNKTADEIVAFVEVHNFEYITLDATCTRTIGENETVELAQKLTDTQRFQPVQQAQGFLLARFV